MDELFEIKKLEAERDYELHKIDTIFFIMKTFFLTVAIVMLVLGIIFIILGWLA